MKVHCTPLDTLLRRDHITGKDIVAGGRELRVLPLGDSITWGFRSADGDGYRQALQEHLAGSNLNFIGSQHSGTMQDNANEGHNGKVIADIAGFAQSSLPHHPNIVLLHAGTNDLFYDPPPQPYDAAPQRLDDLIGEVLAVSPAAAILVAQIIVSGDPVVEARHKTFNEQVVKLTTAREAQGQHVLAVDFSSVQPSELVDMVHPTDEGYRKMAQVWFGAVKDVDQKGWIQTPAPYQ